MQYSDRDDPHDVADRCPAQERRGASCCCRGHAPHALRCDAVKNATNPLCKTCGRSSPSAVLGPGFSESFSELHRRLCESAANTPFVLPTLEAAIEKVYSGRLRSIEALESGRASL